MRVLLLPTVRPPRPPTAAPPPTAARAPAPLPRPPSPTDVAQEWIGLPLRFEIVADRHELEGYQIYAVEKWIVERDRPVTALTVYTGDPANKIIVTALSPSPALSPADAAADWDKAILHLRRDARPKETPHGVVLATSLAHFRSDYTIVHIPHGDFMQVRDHLYANINLLRMGCSGRSALTLEEPSDTTKDRFITTYHLPETIANTAHPASATQPRVVALQAPTRLSISPSERPRNSDDLPPASPRTRIPSTSLHITPPTPTFNVPYGILSPSPAITPGGRYTARAKTKDRHAFSASVLELVKLLQAGLAIFGLFPGPSQRPTDDHLVLDGLLCDKTVEGLTTWVTEIGEQSVNVEPTERIADPAVVCALISLVLATRNKLAAMGYSHTPKDPFLRPQAFCTVLAACLSTSNTPGVFATPTPGTPAFPFHAPHNAFHSLPSTPGPGSAAASTSSFGSSARAAGPVVLTRALVDAIGVAYSDKARAGEGGRVRRARALLGRLDGEASDGASGGEGAADAGGADSGGGQIFTGIGSLVGLNVGGGAVGGGAAGVLEASVDLEAFVRVVVGRYKDKGKSKAKAKEKELRGADGELGDGLAAGGRGKEKEREKDAAVVSGVAGCVTGLWSGLVWGVVSLRERELDSMYGALRSLNPERDRVKERWALGVASDGDMEETDLLRVARPDRADGRSTEEENGGPEKRGGLRSGVQKKFESWARLSRDRKKPSVDISHYAHPAPLTLVGGDAEQAGEEDLSSGQVSPVGAEDPRTPKQFEETRSARSSAQNLNAQEYDRKLSAFNHKRPWGNRMYQSRVSSWSDPVSAREILNRDGELSEDTTGDERSVLSDRHRRRSQLARGSVLGDDEPEVLHEEPDEVGYLSDADPSPPPRRRAATSGPNDLKVLSQERMRIDVALCGQLLVMTRREEHLKNVLACLEILTSSLSDINARLREDYHAHTHALATVERHTRAIGDIDSIWYESQQFQIPDLWHIASPPWYAIFALRDKVFGMGGRRLPPGAHGAHGRFNRLQWTLDGRERLVDHLGRTESEAEEESVVDIEAFSLLPKDDEDEEDVVKHPNMRPMWLLRFFTSWGAKWGAAQPDTNGKVKARDSYRSRKASSST
ncbi:hypothetical protein B0H10DRAFT_2436451 [Mycena sp. CBHHK59/15]|nr:hypothetical protein B0H10DRAFT_2436451 [Mycena sp. CBHHK59/15]